ncbi:MAG: pentapeptide repeat-containing protein [Defluviicoccus sp.]|nr:MAG: pentapeptide repeat-containing protein [Defluviicoccus sp.]
MQGASSWNAQLQGVYFLFSQPNLSGALLPVENLSGAQLQGAELSGALLPVENLSGAQLQGAELSGAQLQGAELRYAQLQGANLSYAQLNGADLSGAQLQGASLSDAQLQSADLRRAGLWQVKFNQKSDLSLANLHDVDLSQLSAEAVEELVRKFASIPYVTERQYTIERIKEALRPQGLSDILPNIRIDDGQPILVSSREDHYFANVAQHLTTDIASYDVTLASYLADLARTDPYVARGIAARWSNPNPGEILKRRRSVPSGPIWRAGCWRRRRRAFTLDLNERDRKTLQDLAARAPAFVSAPSAALPFPIRRPVVPPPRRPPDRHREAPRGRGDPLLGRMPGARHWIASRCTLAMTMGVGLAVGMAAERGTTYPAPTYQPTSSRGPAGPWRSTAGQYAQSLAVDCFALRARNDDGGAWS